MQVVPASEAFVTTQRPTEIWFTMHDGRRVLVHGPRIYLDSVYGYDAAGEQVWVSMGDIRTAEAPRTSVARTTLLLTGIGVGIFLAAVTLGGGGESITEFPVGRVAPNQD